ncbi:hypothetical protein HWV62_11804 [Athelia sp. TMB]|nr:hypothetical protein HWV62_2027 [Athelia sp. TMB]KAF7984799.1 hypothetical protein HWV62_11804 [Athelia sp. TMB]
MPLDLLEEGIDKREGVLRFQTDQPLNKDTFKDGADVPLTYINDSGKQVEVLINIVIYWFVASEKSWYIKFGLPEDFDGDLHHGFHENSYVVHEGKKWMIDHGRHQLHHFEKTGYVWP